MINQSGSLEVHDSSRFNNLLSGVLFVALGSSSYGMLSTFVKLAYKQNFTTAEVTVSQVIWGALILTIMNGLFNKNAKKLTTIETRQLMIAGIPVGLTSVLYYLSVKYIDASVAVVLLMQSVWMGIVVETIRSKRAPGIDKVLAVAMILFGTLMATNVFGASHNLDMRGVVLAVLAAMSFSWALASTQSVASHLHPIKRSQIMMYGACIVVGLFGFLTQLGPYYLNVRLIGEEFIRNQPFNFSIFMSYGLIIAIFGTVIPPIMLNKGFPIVGVGLGSIISAVELPFAMTISFLVLNESVVSTQWLGAMVIIMAIVLLNYKMILRSDC
ncbi:EamA/RhaT family transporter [Bdellovibrio sp. ZAP7]|uniref:EamA family transporter n=1 Tax=Bdellovibrio sp. ZAP7 TaxID=2231053 RepID=UPI0011586D96|nr:DMT family transporter [Bdellovibrio sp. ZAP7]QDK44831.1 EamA/RhaT family transporter [Bdellovibrio sp. ZAP7]